MQSILGELYYNVDFSIAAFLIDLILFTYVKVRYSDITFSNKVYKRLIFIAAMVSLFNVIGSITLTFYDRLPGELVLLVNAVFYHLFLLLAFTFADYIESYFVPSGSKYKRSRLNIALLIVGTILIYALVLTGNVFDITKTGIRYHAYRYFIYVMPLYFYTYTAVRFASEHRKFETDTIAKIVLAGGLAALLITLQATFAPDVLLSDLFVSVALLIFFFTLESPEMFNNLSMQTMKTLAGTIDARDSTMSGHSFRVADVAKLIAGKLGMDELKCENVYRVGLLHDIGKIGISDTVLYNEGDLSDNEYKAAKKHTVIGDEILTHITELPELRKGARWHHERFDGKGYPDGLKGEEIPLIARIIAVADAYDAMVAKRRYGKRFTQEEARNEIEKGSGTQFDPMVAEKMLEIIDEDKDFSLNGDKHLEEFRIESSK